MSESTNNQPEPVIEVTHYENWGNFLQHYWDRPTVSTSSEKEEQKERNDSTHENK